jgi:hypothetical protein
MRSQGLLVPTAVLALLLASCTPADDFPTEWPELAAIEGVLSLEVVERSDFGVPGVYVQLDDRAAPDDIVRAAVEARDTAAGLDAFADGFGFAVLLVHPGDYPASASGWWDDDSHEQAEFEAIVATLASFELPQPATAVSVVVTAVDGEAWEDWEIESFLSLEEPESDTLRAALVEVATQNGLEFDRRIRVEREFPGQ